MATVRLPSRKQRNLVRFFVTISQNVFFGYLRGITPWLCLRYHKNFKKEQSLKVYPVFSVVVVDSIGVRQTEQHNHYYITIDY